MRRLDRAGLTLLAAGIGLSLTNVVTALLGRPLADWRFGAAGVLLAAGVFALAASVLRARR